MSIPKIIHYCWFGGKPLPNKVKKIIHSWEKMCPDYKIMFWNESNYDYTKNRYMADAYKEKKWAFVSDYVRLDVVYQYGGIYLDTDVELIRSLDDILNKKAFFAVERQNLQINTGLGFGAEKNNKHVKALLDLYDNLSFYKKDDSINLTATPVFVTNYFKKLGYVFENVNQLIDEAYILKWEYFCPMDFKTGKVDITNETIGIHWYDASWFTEDDRKIISVERKIRQKFPTLVAKIVCKCYRKSYRLFQYTKEYIKERIK